ncbi:MAG TPA: hypothetical protein VIY52_36145 [Streptosporangiaceae bacterium]
MRELGLPPERTDPNGSGISLGHLIGATGAILVVWPRMPRRSPHS